MSVNQTATNLKRAAAAWGTDMPRWVRLLANACDAISQRSVADRIAGAGFACSSGTVSKLINNKYPASTAEPERAVLAVYGGDEVYCPPFACMTPLSACIRHRRRKLPATSRAHRIFEQNCPTCENNTDMAGAERAMP